MTRTRNLILIGGGVLALVLSLLFSFPLREVFRSAFLAPLIKGYYIIRWYVLRFPQFPLWSGLVLLAFLFLVRGYWKGVRPLPSQLPEARRRRSQKSEFARLSTEIANAQRHSFSRRLLASGLVGLVIRLIAHQEGLSLSAARERFESFAWCDESAVVEFFAYRRHYHGWRRGMDFEQKLKQTISYLERYQEGM